MTFCIHSAFGLHHLGVTPIRKLSGFSNHSIYSQHLVWSSKRSFSRGVRGEVYSYNSIHVPKQAILIFDATVHARVNTRHNTLLVEAGPKAQRITLPEFPWS
jgi:hypothetical protein